MARKGDGRPRSARRRSTASVSFRVTPSEKAELVNRAQKAGYPSLAAWIQDRLGMQPLRATRRDAILVGMVGQIAGSLAALAQSDTNPTPDEVSAILQNVGRQLRQMQQILMGQDGGAG